MGTLGLDTTTGAYLGIIPASTLATVNLVSHLGLYRRWRGAAVGHLALFEMSSVIPMSRYRDACFRLELPSRAAPFYQAHVDADDRHQVIAVNEMVGNLLADEPHLASDMVFGARALDALESRFSDHLLTSWAHHRSSLLRSTRREEQNPGRAHVTVRAAS